MGIASSLQLNRHPTDQLFRQPAARSKVKSSAVPLVNLIAYAKYTTVYGQCQGKKLTASNATKFELTGMGVVYVFEKQSRV